MATDVEIVRTPGSAHVDTHGLAVRDALFERPLEALYNASGMDQFRLCEWGVMKRAVDGELLEPRPPIAHTRMPVEVGDRGKRYG